MGKADKLLQKAKRNPSGLNFEDFISLMRQCGWIKDRQVGSHQIRFSPQRFRLCVQNRKGEAKAYQVKQFLRQYDEEHEHEQA